MGGGVVRAVRRSEAIKRRDIKFFMCRNKVVAFEMLHVLSLVYRVPGFEWTVNTSHVFGVKPLATLKKAHKHT